VEDDLVDLITPRKASVAREHIIKLIKVRNLSHNEPDVIYRVIKETLLIYPLMLLACMIHL